MTDAEKYLDLNKKTWNSRVNKHIASDFYGMPAFKDGKTSLKKIELDLFDDLQNKRILHLQCHFGQDTLSLARMGATVLGLDFSEEAISSANKLKAELEIEAEFICSDVYSLPEKHNEQFDLVFTSYGTIGWLPDIDAWASVVSRALKTGGTFIIVDFHPVIWMHNDEIDNIEFSYFKKEAIVIENSGSYASEGQEAFKEVSWNHSLSSVVTALLNAGLSLQDFQEYDYSPWPCFDGLVQATEGEYVFEKHGRKLPMVYSFKMIKN